MSKLMTVERLREENRNYQGSTGISQNNRQLGFLPAFCDLETGRVELSCFAKGAPAPIHLLAGVPEEWVVSRNLSGEVAAIKQSVVAGFMREGRFYTREEAVSCAG